MLNERLGRQQGRGGLVTALEHTSHTADPSRGVPLGAAKWDGALQLRQASL